MTRLRAQRDEFDALCAATATQLGMSFGLVEKDYWATEALREATSLDLADVEHVVFKGGTSLSKAYGLIRRFSEDVDLIVVLKDGISNNAKKRALRSLADTVAELLGVHNEREREGHGYLNARLGYPVTEAEPILTQGVLLELGTRGGLDPNEPRLIRSLMAEQAERTEPGSTAEFADLASYEVVVLAPERTLAEKLAFLHHRASTGAEDDLRRGGRHLYDVALLLADEDVRNRLAVNPMPDLMVNVDARSEAAGWGFTPRPDEGFAASPAFDAAHETAGALRHGYEQVRALVWDGEMPSYEEALAIVHANASLL